MHHASGTIMHHERSKRASGANMYHDGSKWASGAIMHHERSKRASGAIVHHDGSKWASGSIMHHDGSRRASVIIMHHDGSKRASGAMPVYHLHLIFGQNYTFFNSLSISDFPFGGTGCYKPHIRLISNVVNTLGLSRHDKCWSGSTEFSLFAGLWLVEQFPCICRQTADLIELRFGGQTD